MHAREVKCVVVGDSAMGKSCLLISYTTNSFPREYIPTVSVDGYSEYIPTVSVDDYNSAKAIAHRGRNPRAIRLLHCNLALWDTGGHHGFGGLRSRTYLQTDVFLICFSCDSPSGLENVRAKWMPELQHHDHVPKILVCTKTDLRVVDGRRDPDMVTYKQGSQVAKAIGAEYFECSALTRAGLRDLFDGAVRLALYPSAYRREVREEVCKGGGG